jgi:hypothetical protein
MFGGQKLRKKKREETKKNQWRQEKTGYGM